MNWITDLYIAGSGLLSVFLVLFLLYVSILAMSAFVPRGDSSGTLPSEKEREDR